MYHIDGKHLTRSHCTRNSVGTSADIEVYFSTPATTASTVLNGGTDTVYELPLMHS